MGLGELGAVTASEKGPLSPTRRAFSARPLFAWLLVFGLTPTASASGLPELAVQRHRLDNGLVVLTLEDHSVPTVTFWQFFRAGSRNERPGITGISHFFEHMMFNGSANVPPKEYDRIIEAAGGSSNAYTDWDLTAYYEDIASDRLEVLLELDADRMAGLTLDPAVLASEIEVVKEERRAGTDNDVYGLLNEHLYATAFLASPYRWPVVGFMGDLERIQREEMVEYFRTYYAPNNCVLVLVGDFETEKAMERIHHYFGPLPAQVPPKPPVDSEPPQRGERRIAVAYPSETVSFQVGYKAVAANHPDAAVLEVLANVLARGEASRLSRAMMHDDPVALSADVAFYRSIHPCLVEMSFELLPGRTLAEGESVLDRVLQEVVASGPTERELARAKKQIEADLVRSLQTNNGLGGQLGYYEVVMGGFEELARQLERVREVGVEDCRRVAARTFVASRRTLVHLVPPTEDAGEDAEDVGEDAEEVEP